MTFCPSTLPLARDRSGHFFALRKNGASDGIRTHDNHHVKRGEPWQRFRTFHVLALNQERPDPDLRNFSCDLASE